MVQTYRDWKLSNIGDGCEERRGLGRYKEREVGVGDNSVRELFIFVTEIENGLGNEKN
jgi:hypothetical protein